MKPKPTSIILHKRKCILCLNYKSVRAGCKLVKTRFFVCTDCAEKR